ncbi:hypothetical protein AQUCO_00300815v1 [Aquilegia coerulea]|uniref:Fe2OG dioxygenase domain-containing protein n=1 Tax=Aquilegia coerulea TaxID=218851 RepID=A0A2G5F0P9_AQUCA|nr:hypothetical protein AQUCO_00300815v1 [Aquilegia coerulea]
MAPVPFSPIKIGQIDDVQELRKARPATIPERFVRDIAERPFVAKPSMHIPVIDLSKLIEGDLEQFHTELSKLSTSCEEWGFFQVINHGIDKDLLQNIEKVATEFFMLPLEEKQRYPMAPGTVQGYGQAFVFSENQKLDWCNMLALGVEPHFIRNPKLWPTNPANFSETLEMYSANIRGLSVRMNYYPPCSRPDLVLGLSPHSDGSALTVLQQAAGSSIGLQILKDDTWIPVQPVPNALVINIGDTLEVLTNGKYRSVEHRAVTHKYKDRLSIVTFYAPSYEIDLGPLPQLVDENRPCMYKNYNHGEYSKHYVTNKLQGKKTLEFAKIQHKLSC